MIWVSLFSNLGKKQGKGRTLGTILPLPSKETRKENTKGFAQRPECFGGGQFLPMCEGVGGGGSTLQAIGFLVSGSRQPSFVLVWLCTRPARNRKRQQTRRAQKPFLASAENPPRARGWKASLWPGWVSPRNKKVRRTKPRPAHAKTSPERLFFPSNYARRSGNPAAVQPFHFARRRRLLRGRNRPVPFASTPFQPPAGPGPRGPHDPAGRLPPRRPPPSRPGLPARAPGRSADSPAPGLVLPPSAAAAPAAPSNGNRCPRRPGCPAPPAAAQLLHAPRPTGMNPAALLAPPRPAELSAPALPGRSGCSGCRGRWCNGLQARGPDKPVHGFTLLTPQPRHWVDGGRWPPPATA